MRDGTYHHLYTLNSNLAALAVLDITPSAVSAVYFLYDPSLLGAWSPGKLSALHEAALAMKLEREWYYMGYWIKGCAKMEYKKEFRPQEVLRRGDGVWRALEEVDEELERKTKEGVQGKWKTPSEAERAGVSLRALGMEGCLSEEDVRELNLDEVLIAVGKGVVVPAEMLVAWERGDEEDPRSLKGVAADLASAIGGEVAKRMVVDLSEG